MDELKSNLRTFRQREYLVHQHELSRHMFVIQSGKVQILRREGKHIIQLGEAGPGGLIGELSLLDGQPRSASALAITAVEAAIVNAMDFDRASKRMPPWLSAMGRAIAHRLRSVDKHLERSPETYLYSSILSMLVYYAVADSGKTEFRHAELAKNLREVLRVPPESVEMEIGRLLMESHLVKKDDKIIIPDLERLEDHLKEVRRSLRREQLQPFS